MSESLGRHGSSVTGHVGHRTGNSDRKTIEPADETGHDLDREDTGEMEAQKDAARHGEATGDHGHTPTQVTVPK